MEHLSYPLDVRCDVGVDSRSWVVQPSTVCLSKGDNANEEPETQDHGETDLEMENQPSSKIGRDEGASRVTLCFVMII